MLTPVLQIFVRPKDFEMDEGDTSDDQNSAAPKISTTAEDTTKDGDGQPAEVKTPSGHKREV